MKIPMSRITELVLTKDYKRDIKKLTAELLSGGEYNEVMYCLHNGITLPEQYKDHALQSNWKGYRDCHVKNNLVLIYKVEETTLYLLRLAPHSDLFKKNK